MMYTDDPNHIFHRKIPECVCTQQPVKEGIEGENPSPCSRDTFFFIWWEHPSGKRKKFEYVIRAYPSGTIIARYCTSSLSACTCLLVWIDRFPRRGLRYLWRAATRQAIMDGQCSIDTARFEIMARTRNAVWRSLNEQPNRIRLENRRAANFRLVRFTLALTIAFSCRT